MNQPATPITDRANQSISCRSAGAFYVEGDWLPCIRLSEARARAGMLQAQGQHRSLQIMQDGIVVSLKRF